MALVNQPSILPMAFAAQGDKNTIPATGDLTSGLASIAQGFPPITQQPLAQGGLPPQRADFNGIFNLFSQFLLYLQNGGVFTYNAALDYQPPAIVADSHGKLYKCLQANGPDVAAGAQPLSNSEYWAAIASMADIASALGAYLPLTGGTLTGPLSINANNLIGSIIAQNNQGLSVTRFDDEQDGSGMYLFDDRITFCIYQSNSQTTFFQINQNTLLYNNKPILYSSIGNGATADYIVTNNNSDSTWYQKYASGKIVQGGSVSVKGTATVVTFPLPFTTKIQEIQLTHYNTLTVNNAAVGVEASDITLTKFVPRTLDAANAHQFYWMAVGY